MKISTAKKIKSALNDVLNTWAVDQGGAYVFSSPQVYITIGKPNGTDCKLVNTGTIGAKTLDDCLRLDFSEPFKSRDSFLAFDNADINFIVGSDFINALKRTLKIISEKSPRSYGQVALVCSNGDGLNVVATDGFILYEHNEIVRSKPFSFVLGVKEIKAITNLLGNGAIEISISADKSFVGLKQNSITACVKTSSVRYPNYKPVIPDFTMGHKAGAWDKDTPKSKGAISALYDYAETTYWGKNGIKLGTVKNAPRLDFVSAVYNPRYIDFVNDSTKEIGWYQSKNEPSAAPIVFRSCNAPMCVETTVIVPITYKPEELEKMRA